MKSIIIASLLLCACVADPAIDDLVTSQESAVEEAPAPTPEEDMRIRQLYLACYNNCGNYYFSCLLVYCHLTSNMNCAAQANENACSCEAGCSGEQSSCWEGCSNLFNHRN